MRAAVLVLAACNAFAAPAPDGERLVLTGTVHATEAVTIAAPVTDESNLAIRWLVDDGTTVKAGERVAELDAAPVLERVRQGRTRLETAEAQVKLAARSDGFQLAAKRLAVRQQEIAREKAALRAEVPASLVPARTAREAARELVRADEALAAARRALVAGKQTLALEAQIRELGLADTRAAVGRDEATLEKLVLVAPRAGVVRVAGHLGGGRLLRTGDTVEQAQRIATMPDLARPMEVMADLADVDDGRVAVGDVATCTLDAVPTEHHACSVIAIAPIARAPSVASLRRAFAVRLALAAHVRPGLSVKVAFGRPEALEATVLDTSPIEVTGELVAASAVDVNVPMFRERGYLTVAWIAPDGEPVAAGAPVVRFDDSELARSISDTQIEIAELEQRLSRKRSEVALAARDQDLRVKEAESAAQRAALKTEVPAALVASLDLRAQKLDAELARITLLHTREQVAFAKRSDAIDLADIVDTLAESQRRLGELRENRPKLNVVAPRAGTWVSTRKVGESIYIGEVAGQLVGLDEMRGVGVIDEVDLGRVKRGMPVTLRLAAMPDGELRGTLAEVTADVLARETDQSKVVRVKLVLDATTALVRPGMQFRGTVGGVR